MQNRGDYNHQPSPNPPDPGTLGLRGKKEKDVAMVDVAKGKEDDTVLVLEGKKKEGEDDDFIMTDVGSESVGFPVKGSTTSEDVTLAVDLDKAFENDLSGKEGRGMKMVPTEGPGEEKDDDRLEEWQCDDSMFGESKQESDDEFDFDSEEEGEESRGGSYSVVPSLSKAFDLNLLRDCIEKGEDSLRHIEGKDVILIVGKTGTGKSCLIQGIAGKSFKKASFSCGDAVSKDVFEARDPVPGFEIGHAKVSMTKHIKCFFREGNTNREIAYLDTPGFEDTEGEEIDVGTSCMLSQVAKKCRTMRFVMMINYVSLLEDRGGAMRSILKFMRNFVRDFNKEKKSFMFLFTHADEIKDVPDSLEGAKKSLLNEIIRTLSGTQDDDVKDLLSFIRKSLEKGYPFADVLHPLKTDYKSLVNFMEHKLKTTKVLGENGSCGLTLSSQMRLSGAAQTLLRNLRMLLGQGDVDIAEVCEIQRAFKFFDKYINCEDMRVAVADCNGIMCDHVKSLHGVVERELYNGTNSTGTFNDLNVSHLNNALSQLQAVDLSFDMRAQLNRIHREVTKFQNRLFIDPARESFNGFHQDLQKLKTWSTFTTDCQLLLDPVIAHVATIVKEATNAISFFNESGTCSSSKSTLQQAFLNLKVLKSINENARSLSLYIEGVNNASEVMNNFLFQLKSSAEVWNEQLTTAGKEVNFGDLQGIQDLVSHIQTLDMVSGLLKDIGLEDEIFLLVEFIRKTITSKITGRFSNACLDLKSIDYGHDALWSEKIYVLRDVLSAFSPLEGSQWKNMESSYMTVVDGMKSRLRAKSGELDEISQSAVSHGLVDGMRDGKAVSIFARYQWFDNFLPSEERFVRNCVTKITNDYSRMFSASAESVEGIIFWLSSHTENPLELAEATIELKSSLSDISECARFGSTIEEQDLSNRAAELFDKLEVYMRIRVGAWKKTLDEWVGTVLNKSTDWEKVTVVTEDLNFMLWEVQEMVDISCAQDVQVLIKSVQDEIISTMVNFKEQVKSSFDSQISYEEIALSLARVQALGDFSRTSPYLPRVEDLKEAARQRVSNDAKKIEDLVEETSEFDEIDRLLVQFERASVLDEFVSQEVSSRLRPLKRLRTDKEEDVDECIKEMIQNNDFSGLGAFLQPLAKSRNQIQRRKFEKYVDKINDSLKEVDRKFHYNFHGTMTEEGCQKIASILKILDQANDQVGDYLPKKKHAPSIGTKVRDYKKKINTKFNTMLNKMNTAIKRADFVDITKVNGPITIASKYFGPYLTDNSERKRKEVIESYSELKQSIPSHIRTFVETSFSESKEIEKILSGLKPIAEMKDPVFIDLVQLYDETAKALLEQVNELVQKVKDSSAEAQCYDDAVVIIQNLTRALEKGLGDHLPQTLHDDCKTTLRKLEEHRKEEFEISFEASSAAFQLKAIGKTMDKLDPDASIWNFSKFLTGRRTYDNLKNKWSIEALQIYRRGSKALKRREFTTLNESLFLLSLMNDTIASHVTIVSSKLQDLKGETVGAFLLLCKSSQDALQSENCRAFETLFADYRGFVIGITCLMKVPDAVKSFNATNQLVYERMGKEVSSLNETLDSARDGFDFAVMKQKIEAVRAFGGFIADRFSTFHEELKGVGHVKSDRWLGMLHGMILKHYQNGRDLQRLKFYAILEVFPSASKNEVKQAYGEKCGKLLASKESDISRSALAHINDAMSELEKDEAHQRDRTAKPFDDEVCGIGNGLRETTRKALKEQDYDLVEATLFKLQGIEIIEHLVSPKLDTQKIRDSVIELVKNHVEKVRIEVSSNWSQRMYQDLNHNISDLKLMEEKFKSYSYIFPSSWSTGIVESVQKEIDKLGNDASSLLQTRTAANESRDEFRRCFMRMGAVLVELPLFKDYTKNVMSDVLESCLNSDWGYGFVFELGLSLQKGEDTNNDDEVRIAQNLVTEFGHFKEVLTMVWNEETIQKPPEDTVMDIRGHCLDQQTMNESPLGIDSDGLLEQFFEFESLYTSFLGEYLSPGADLNALVKKTVDLAETLTPISCDHGFGDKMKEHLPTIMAGVFALFTVLKSGESFNRLEEVPSGDSIDSTKLLMKPHNIQVMTLLCMFGCGSSGSSSLQSQLMQIRTGEGKSMILGAAAVIFGLLGFQVRCICYSEYLSNRDYELFHDVFRYFGLLGSINYSKITTLSEETTAAKGNIRDLTLSLMHGNLCCNSGGNQPSSQVADSEDVSSRGAITVKKNKGTAEEIMLVDEVDVFFGCEFYGQTYNQVAQLKEPEVATILRRIWEAHKRGGKRLRLADVKEVSEYKDLNLKIPGFEYLLENEIALMLDQVRRVDDEPSYHLNRDDDRIGYKIQDTISYQVTYGYRTVFAYLKEADNGNLKNRDATLSRVLTMPISCGQFSYANIKPTRILGVSGTLEVMSDYQKNVLQKYGVSQYLYIPSVYGQSNFTFDKVGDGVSIERGESDFFQKITEEISKVATKQKRAVIVFFNDTKRLMEYTSSAFYRKLGRKKVILTENKSGNEKAFVISKAATTGQITICTAVFGRGTDFFCKDDALENNGGVHVIQTFLSSDMSEEIQIQGRTARQGKQGSYKLILLDKDLEDDFGINCGETGNWPRGEFYSRLCEARDTSLQNMYQSTEMSLSKAKQKDDFTHDYFGALLDSNASQAKKLLKELYINMKKKHTGPISIDLAFAIDVTGSMTPYSNAIVSTIQSLLDGPNSILAKLSTRFPDNKFKLQIAVLGFRDIDDGNHQFEENLWSGSTHFNENGQEVLRFVKTLTSSSSGGSDLAEDHLGAIQRCVEWDSAGDWEGMIKAILLITDAPAHGYALTGSSTQNIDSYNVRHPQGLTTDSVVEEALKKDIDLFVCSFDPVATEKFEDNISETYNEHPSNMEGREVTLVPLVPKSATQSAARGILGDSRKHNIFVLDESGSMQYSWSGVVAVYNKYKHNRRQHQHDSDLVSVVQFDDRSRVTCQLQNIVNSPVNLSYAGGGTSFSPAAGSASTLARQTPPSHAPVIIFMSDGMANDSSQAANTFAALNKELKSRSGDDLELHVIGFGGGTDTSQLQQIASASANGRVHTTSDIDGLSKVFVQIAGGGDNVASVLEAEIGKRISDAVTNRLSVEYLG